MQSLQITDHPAGPRLAVRVKPRSSRSAILGTRDGMLLVTLAAPPVDGEANTALLSFLSDTLARPKSSVKLISGTRSRTKLLQFSGIDATQLRDLLESTLATSRRK